MVKETESFSLLHEQKHQPQPSPPPPPNLIQNSYIQLNPPPANQIYSRNTGKDQLRNRNGRALNKSSSSPLNLLSNRQSNYNAQSKYYIPGLNDQLMSADLAENKSLFNSYKKKYDLEASKQEQPAASDLLSKLSNNNNKYVKPIQRPSSTNLINMNLMNNSDYLWTGAPESQTGLVSQLETIISENKMLEIPSEESLVTDTGFTEFKLFGADSQNDPIPKLDNFSSSDLWSTNNSNQPWNSVLLNNIDSLVPSQSPNNNDDINSGNRIKSLWSNDEK